MSSLDGRTQDRIAARIARLEVGNLGDWKLIGDGVRELRFQFGAGYRVYYGMVGSQIVLLLMGGSKGTQKRDIRTAREIWSNYQKQ